jgi:Xaa-Pro aminopeptidase
VFKSVTYASRRADLASKLDGLVILPGNGESPINYDDNPYPFRQDSTFLYYFGLSRPNVAAVIDADEGSATVFGNDPTVDEIVWTGDVESVAAAAERAGVAGTRPRDQLASVVSAARESGRRLHWLRPYRATQMLELSELLDLGPAAVEAGASEPLVRAVVAQRSRKDAEEVEEIERAVATSVAMHVAALRLLAPGVTESAIAAEVERVAQSAGGRLSFPVIATIHGETLHNHARTATLSEGDLFLLDAGAETAMGYAGDLTTTCPVSREFSTRQKDVYEILLATYEAAVAALAPGVPYRDVHLKAAESIFEGMKGLGLMRGDTEEAVAAGAPALVFPHGLGHMMGLDVHDMENLGEDLVGYGDGWRRSDQFGLRSLRLARPLEPGFVFTVEPGIYFIPKLIESWRQQEHLAEFIDYDALEGWYDFGGARNEEDYVITDDGARRIGPRKPQTPEEMAALRA